MGLFVMAMGVQMFLNTENPLIVLGSLLIGTLLGEWWKIEDGLQQLREIPGTAIFARGRRWLKQIRARVSDRLTPFLCRPNDHSRLHPGWVDRGLQFAGG